ncbi:serine hydrolase [Arenibacter latericius]|uniref:serine hydrolase n=1 Tax=Arenibacter latericius TaxID=86104 RepID=UPI0003F6F217|nr:serine hydrolase [Arenibacter latericius]
MPLKPVLLITLLTLLISGCSEPVKPKNLLDIALSSTNPKIKRVMDSVNNYELQLIYTQIKRKKDSVTLTDYFYHTNDSNYFYPASTVKLITAALTLEKLQQTAGVDYYSRFYIEGDSIETTFAHDILKIFSVSDNEANNRLFEFLGQDYINEKLKEKQVSPVRISHRLSTPNAFEVTTTPLIVYLNDTTTTPITPTINTPPTPLALNGIIKGNAYYEDDNLIQQPFDFNLRNHFPLNAQLQVLKRIVFPELYKKEAQFNLGDKSREFLLKAMSTLPRELGYDTNEYYDGYGKFLMFGDNRNKIPDNLKIYNKVGSAYGTLTDCAYIVDTENNIEFMLAGTIPVNQNRVFNDDKYEYKTIGLPFLAQLGREIYELELQRR